MERPDFTLAHLSDLHAAPPRLALPTKRVLTWLSWRLHRGTIHRSEVLEALIRDLGRSSPDHVAVTGDLTNTGGERECGVAARWLARLGPPEDVTVVPGNHDALVDETGWKGWREHLAADPSGEGEPDPAWPRVRVRGRMAVVGLSSAEPTSAFDARGRLGAEQLARLEARLTELGERGLCRVVLIHHPPHAGATVERRSLRDATPLRRALQHCGAELVLHGHLHRVSIARVPGPSGPIPVVGVPSASAGQGSVYRRARYHLVEVRARARTGGFDLALCSRGYDPASGEFRAVDERQSLGGA